jgi:hypothetical protein
MADDIPVSDDAVRAFQVWMIRREMEQHGDLRDDRGRARAVCEVMGLLKGLAWACDDPRERLVATREKLEALRAFVEGIVTFLCNEEERRYGAVTHRPGAARGGPGAPGAEGGDRARAAEN